MAPSGRLLSVPCSSDDWSPAFHPISIGQRYAPIVLVTGPMMPRGRPRCCGNARELTEKFEGHGAAPVILGPHRNMTLGGLAVMRGYLSFEMALIAGQLFSQRVLGPGPQTRRDLGNCGRVIADLQSRALRTPQTRPAAATMYPVRRGAGAAPTAQGFTPASGL